MNRMFPDIKNKRNRMVDRIIVIASVLVVVSFGIFRSRHAGLIGLLAFTFMSALVPVLLILAAFWITRFTIRSSAIARTAFLVFYVAIFYWFYAGSR